jgi:peptidoglycan/xylan/chitin deacetylase (PgdA/CDA1 family)
MTALTSGRGTRACCYKWLVLLKDPRVKRALYRSGALDAWHRRRNRDRLTVIMFHRVLAESDPRWPTSDPEYTLPERLFAASLRFFRRHYHVVALDDVLAARAGRRALPERPLLITFDDGWSDNEEYALRHLRDAGLPAVMFVASDAVDRAQPFWQEQIITAWRRGERLAAAWAALGQPVAAGDGLEPARALIAALEKAPAELRRRVLADLAAVLDDGVRYMIDTAQLQRLAAGRVAIGAHGQTHAPLTEVDAGAELTTARRELERRLGNGAAVTTLSFPHGRFDDGVVRVAKEAGFRLLFTSVPELPPARGDGALLGRVGFTAETISGPDGELAPELLALHLFRKPHARS